MSYLKYSSKRALSFCNSRAHANELTGVFCKHGIPAVAMVSGKIGEYAEDRSVAIRKLEAGEVWVIFSVDMFNEGADIPDVDMVMFFCDPLNRP